MRRETDRCRAIAAWKKRHHDPVADRLHAVIAAFRSSRADIEDVHRPSRGGCFRKHRHAVGRHDERIGEREDSEVRIVGIVGEILWIDAGTVSVDSSTSATSVRVRALVVMITLPPRLRAIVFSFSASRLAARGPSTNGPLSPPISTPRIGRGKPPKRASQRTRSAARRCSVTLCCVIRLCRTFCSRGSRYCGVVTTRSNTPRRAQVRPRNTSRVRPPLHCLDPSTHRFVL